MFVIAEIITAQAGTAFPAQRFHDRCGQFRVLVYTEEHVDLGNLFQQVPGVTLAEAAGDHKYFAAPGLLVFSHIQDRVDGFLLGRIDKSAGIHQQDISLCGIFRQQKAVFRQQSEGRFRVDPVFVAAEGNRSDSISHETPFPSCGPYCVYNREVYHVSGGLKRNGQKSGTSFIIRRN